MSLSSVLAVAKSYALLTVSYAEYAPKALPSLDIIPVDLGSFLKKEVLESLLAPYNAIAPVAAPAAAPPRDILAGFSGGCPGGGSPGPGVGVGSLPPSSGVSPGLDSPSFLSSPSSLSLKPISYAATPAAAIAAKPFLPFTALPILASFLNNPLVLLNALLMLSIGFERVLTNSPALAVASPILVAIEPIEPTAAASPLTPLDTIPNPSFKNFHAFLNLLKRNVPSKPRMVPSSPPPFLSAPGGVVLSAIC